MAEAHTDTSYRLAPVVAVRTLGRALVVVGLLVVLVTAVSSLAGWGAVPAMVVAVAGVLLLAAQALWLLRLGRVLRLTESGYAVGLLHRVGARHAAWEQVHEAVAAEALGRPCLVLTLHDGRLTVIPMAALAADRDDVALAVRRRLRDAHTEPGGGRPGTEADSAGAAESL